MGGVAGQGQRPAWRPLLAPLLILLLLAGWWALLLPRAERSVFARVPVLDEVYYLDRAAQPDPDAPFFVSPLYPGLIALAGSARTVADAQVLPPRALRGIRALQVGLWLGTVLLLHLIARRTLGPWVRQALRPPWSDALLWLPSLLFVLYRPAAVYTVAILLEMPLVFLVTLFLYLLTWFPGSWFPGVRFPGTRRPGVPWPALPAGLALGAAALLRGTALALLPVGVLAIWTSGAGRRPKGIATLVLLAAAAAPLLPAAVHNSVLAGRPVGPTLNGGVNLYIGNGPEANGFYVVAVPGDWRRDPAGTDFLAGRLGLEEVSLAAADSIWTRAALDAVRERPGRALGLWVTKVWLHLQAWEIDQLTPLAGWTREVPLLRVLAVPYGLLVVLGLAGLAATAGALPAARLWAWSLGLLVAAQSVFFVVSRYRLVLVPLLCLGAAAGVILLATLAARGRRPVLGAGPLPVWAGTAVLVALVTIPWGLAEVRALWLPLAQANEALRWGLLGEAEQDPVALGRAVDLYRAAVAGHAREPGPWLGLAATLKAQGERREAEKVLTGALLQVRHDLELRRMLVGLLLEDGRRSDALVQAQALLRAYPDDAETLHNTTVLLAGLGNLRAALAHAEQLAAAHPEDVRAALDLGVILARSGRPDEARAAFLQGLRHHPDNPDLKRNLELLDGGQGRGGD